MDRPTVLLIDADTNSRRHLAHSLDSLGFEAMPVSDLESALRALVRGRRYSAIVCDCELPDGAGINFVHWLRAQVISTPVILMNDRVHPRWPCSAFFTTIMKPAQPAALRSALSRFGLCDVEPEAESVAA